MKNDEFAKIVKYAEGRLNQNESADRAPYSIATNNCGTFARDTIAAGGVETPTQLDPRPTSYAEEMQSQFSRVPYDPKKKDVERGGKSCEAPGLLKTLWKNATE